MQYDDDDDDNPKKEWKLTLIIIYTVKKSQTVILMYIEFNGIMQLSVFRFYFCDLFLSNMRFSNWI